MKNVNLSIIPANDEFRFEALFPVSVKGTATGYSAENLSTKARHNGIAALLKSKGLKSVQSRRILSESRYADQVWMKYEGVLLMPVKILNQGFKQDPPLYEVEMEVMFAPFAFPDKWPYLRFKKKILKNLDDVLSVFR